MKYEVRDRADTSFELVHGINCIVVYAYDRKHLQQVKKYKSLAMSGRYSMVDIMTRAKKAGLFIS